MNSDRTGFYAFLGASAVAALLAIVSVMNPFGSSSADVETSTDQLTSLTVPTSAPAATPHPTAVFSQATPTPTPKPKPKKAKPTPTAASTAPGDATNKKTSNSTSGTTTAVSSSAPKATETPATTDENTNQSETNGTQTDDDSESNQDAQALTTNDATTGTVGGTTAANGSRALSAGEASTYVAFAQTSGRIEVFDAPNGNPIQTTFQWLSGDVTDYPLANPTYFGNQLVLRVVEGGPGDEWIRVALPIRPNERTGWVRGSDFQVGSSNWYVEVNKSNNSVSVWNGEELVLQTTAVLGSSSYPTPAGSGFVEEVVAGPNAAYGPYVMSVGIFSNAHNDFSGGVPKIAIHGTNQEELMGQNASNGCVRVPNSVISQIVNMVPLGTRVQIVG